MTAILRTASGVLLALVLAASLALGTMTIIDQSRAATVACHQVNQLRSAIVTVLSHSEASIGQSPYYKNKPAAAAAAKQQFQYYLDHLQPVAC